MTDESVELPPHFEDEMAEFELEIEMGDIIVDHTVAEERARRIAKIKAAAPRVPRPTTPAKRA